MTVAPPVELRRAPTGRQLRTDVVGAVLLTAGTAFSTYLYAIVDIAETGSVLWHQVLYVLFLAGPLALRRVLPSTVALVVSVAYLAGMSAGVQEYLFGSIALFIAIYSVGAWASNRFLAMLTRAVIIAAMLIWLVLSVIWQAAAGDFSEDTGSMEVSARVAMTTVNLLVNLLFFAGAYWFGDSAYRSAMEHDRLVERTAQLEAERRRTAEQAVSLERLRIARELHDVVAHHVSVMGLQATAAGRVLDRDPEAARIALGAVESSAREAVGELHRLVSTLRDPAGGADDASTVTLDRLDSLIAEVRDAGLAVTLERVGEPAEVGRPAQFAVYRLVQEALTNVSKHSRMREAAVRLRFRPGTLEVEVSNEGSEALAAIRRPGGFGLLGMRERVEAVGGQFESGPKPRGGWRVRAVVPVASSGEGRRVDA